MNDVIHLLPDSVANQIAAGEVIQRPASVIKELVENSVDAGASRIEIVLKDAGRTLIQVIDNGCGMTDTDARMAFERHATSKILKADDLFALRTMGFRGEALPSIAAIARLDVRSRRQGAPIGTRLIIEASRVESQQPEACNEGTSLMVKDLFYNVPARRRFLKKDATEWAAVLREFERLALVNPGLDLSLTHNGTVAHQLRRGTMLKRISDLFGKDLGQKLIPVQAETSIVKIEGFITLPEHSRRRSPLQYLFVNGRNMRHPYFHKAIVMCYSSLLPPEVQPGYFINFTVDPSTIDVNIHPTKNEIKFEDEQAVWQILTSAVNESLGRYNAAPAIDFNRTDAPDIPAFAPTSSASAPIPADTPAAGGSAYNPFRSGAAPSSSSGRPKAPSNWEELYRTFSAETSHRPAAPGPAETLPPAQERQGLLDLDFDVVAPSTIQVRNRYIVAPSQEGLMIIDQHRAHKLVLYHNCLENAGAPTAAPSQKLMFASDIDIPSSLDLVMQTLAAEASLMGFGLVQKSPGRWTLEGAPPSLTEGAARELVLNLLNELAPHDDSAPLAADALRRRVALSIAEAGAVKAGQPLRPDEIDRIAAALFSLPSPCRTPDGQKVLITIDFDQISQWLG